MKNIVTYLILLVLVETNVFAQRYFQTRWQNKPRNAIVYLPRNFNANENLPVVVNMHGFLTTAQFQFDYTQFHKLADSVRCIVIYPEGVDLRWNSGTFFFVSSTVDDVGYIGDWLDRAAVLYNADLKKAYSMGYSAGGFMSYKLACDATNRIAAIAPNVASMVNDNLSSCVPARPISISAFNGLSDPITPYNGFPGNFPSIDSIKHFWQIKNGCDVVASIDTLADVSNDGTRVIKYTYNNCDENVQQFFYKIINGGHVWPGAANIFFDLIGKTTQDISMNREAWNFFKTKEIPINVRCDAPTNLQSTNITADSFQLSWQAVSGVVNYKVALADDSDRVTFYETNSTSFAVKINPLRVMRWNVASLCSSGYHNWNTTRLLNGTPTSIISRKQNQVHVFPNPCNDVLQMDLPKTISPFQYKIYNTIGEEVLSANTVVPAISTVKLAKGTYYLLLQADDTYYSTLFIKE